jgi:L-rhamnose 1-dehydrogenase
LSSDLFSKTVSINLSGAFYATQAAARQMAAQSPQGGSIIGISSISALVGGGQQTHYTPTKAGILSLMQSCAVALGKHKIRCNALLPGTIRTQLNEEDLKEESKRTYMEGRIPLGRLGQPADLAGPAVFLACEQLSSYVVSDLMIPFGHWLYHVHDIYNICLSTNNIPDRCTTARRWRVVCESPIIGVGLYMKMSVNLRQIIACIWKL